MSSPSPSPASFSLHLEDYGTNSKPKRKKAKGDAAASSSLTPPVSFSACQVSRQLATVPVVEPMSVLLREHPHTAQDSACRTATDLLVSRAAAASLEHAGDKRKAAGPSAKPRTTMLRVQTHFDASQHVPGGSILRQLRDRLEGQLPTYRDKGSAVPVADPVRELRTLNLAHLPLVGAKMESLLLRQSGRFREENGLVYDWPPCREGNRCVAYREQCLGAGGMKPGIDGLTDRIVLTRFIPFETLQAMMQGDPAAVRQLGETEAPCILCHREALCEAVHFGRTFTAQGGLTAPAVPIQEEVAGQVAQLWRNKVDCPDGYFKKYMLLPRAGELAIEPIAHLMYWALKAVRNPTNGRWEVDQSPLQWKPRPAPTPFIGESLQSF
jgi:hypothetical protein